MIWLVLLGLVGWFLVFAFIDRPQYPTYKARDWFRILAVAQLFLILALLHKAMLWREELRSLVQSCQ